VDLTTGVAIVSGIAATVYVVETASKYGYALFKKSPERPLEDLEKILSLPLLKKAIWA
jgi:hypothetical protein